MVSPSVSSQRSWTWYSAATTSSAAGDGSVEEGKEESKAAPCAVLDTVTACSCATNSLISKMRLDNVVLERNSSWWSGT